MIENSEDGTGEIRAYDSKVSIIRNLFWKRINTAIELGQINDNSSVLDIGCHPGNLLKTIRSKNSFCKCYGIDANPNVLNIKIENTEIKYADAKRLPYPDNTFDVVFALDVLEHIIDIDTTIEEIHRVLKNQGVFIISGPTESWFYKLCRFLWLRTTSFSEHVRTIYDIEKKFNEKGFHLVSQKSLPAFPIPKLFRISKFQKN